MNLHVSCIEMNTKTKEKVKKKHQDVGKFQHKIKESYHKVRRFE